MDEASAKELLEWLCSQMHGSLTVRPDGAREPQIRWGFPNAIALYGPSPLEAIQNAMQADKHQTTKEQ